jgi:hypothetical protein
VPGVDKARGDLIARNHRGLDGDLKIGHAGDPPGKEIDAGLLLGFSGSRRRSRRAELMIDIVLGKQVGERLDIMGAQRSRKPIRKR